jgi:hypothetical protein
MEQYLPWQIDAKHNRAAGITNARAVCSSLRLMSERDDEDCGLALSKEG